jgi:hypothetical protein
MIDVVVTVPPPSSITPASLAPSAPELEGSPLDDPASVSSKPLREISAQLAIKKRRRQETAERMNASPVAAIAPRRNR